mmetsp:Transcript_24368/g.27768  ORF Transcript_24368/g.27768 Transcript_24368/m.27768 type:complete len:233 (-) Transcript_24368:869-1567(-)
MSSLNNMIPRDPPDTTAKTLSLTSTYPIHNFNNPTMTMTITVRSTPTTRTTLFRLSPRGTNFFFVPTLLLVTRHSLCQYLSVNTPRFHHYNDIPPIDTYHHHRRVINLFVSALLTQQIPLLRRSIHPERLNQGSIIPSRRLSWKRCCQPPTLTTKLPSFYGLQFHPPPPEPMLTPFLYTGSLSTAPQHFASHPYPLSMQHASPLPTPVPSHVRRHACRLSSSPKPPLLPVRP